jgi:hypothetical protein
MTRLFPMVAVLALVSLSLEARALAQDAAPTS